MPLKCRKGCSRQALIDAEDQGYRLEIMDGLARIIDQSF
jgi:hypothetical protein